MGHSSVISGVEWRSCVLLCDFVLDMVFTQGRSRGVAFQRRARVGRGCQALWQMAWEMACAESAVQLAGGQAAFLDRCGVPALLACVRYGGLHGG